jgi:hypothetical protein
MTKVVKLHPKPTAKGTPWFMTDDLHVGRRLRFKSFKLKDEEVYKITKIMNRHWEVRRSKQVEVTSDRVMLMSPTGDLTERGVMGVRISVNWELLDD